MLWYPTFGAIVGVFGLINNCPFKNVTPIVAPCQSGRRVVELCSDLLRPYDAMQAMMVSVFGAEGVLSSPFWFVLEGVLIAIDMDYTATRLAGEGNITVWK